MVPTIKSFISVIGFLLNYYFFEKEPNRYIIRTDGRQRLSKNIERLGLLAEINQQQKKVALAGNLFDDIRAVIITDGF